MASEVMPSLEAPLPFEFETPGLTAEILAARTPEALDPILTKLSKSMPALGAPSVRGHRLFVKGLDDAIPHIARTLQLDDRQGEKSNDNVCVIATQLYGVGGHSKVVADITRLIGGEKVSLILTDLYGNISYRRLIGEDMEARGYHCRALLALKAPSVLDRTVELYRVLCAIKPTRIFLLHHHMDVCAVAAAYPFRDVAEFIHHADHLPCLGATVGYSAHVDLTYTCHPICAAAGLNPIYSGMTLPGLSIPQPAEKTDGALVFGTCGNISKYKREGRSSRYRWVDWVIPILRTPNSTFIHIGPTDAALEQEVRQGLADAALDPQRYVFLGPTPNLQAALVANQVDVYVSSYPEGGGRATLEALAAGVPAIAPSEAEMGPLVQFSSPLSGWALVYDPAQLPAAITDAVGRRDAMRGASYRSTVQAELERFEQYVAGRPLGPAPTARN